MSNPENAATQPGPTAPVDSKPEPSAEEKAAVAEQRRKDTLAAYTKGQQTIKALEAEKEKLLELVSNSFKVTLTPEEQESLDKLKYEDPEAWRSKLNSLETAASSQARENIASLTGEAKKAAEIQFEYSQREQLLTDFNASAKIAITDDVIANDVPPRITKKLAEGKITFEEFLTEVSTYLETGKVVKNEDVLGQPNLGKLAGGTTPSDAKPEASLASNYVNDIY